MKGSLFLSACVLLGCAVWATGQQPVASGAALFHEKGCEHCHGVNFAGVPDKGPSLLTVGKRLKKDALAKQIHDGGQEMPAFGDALQDDEITALVDMLAKKKKAPKGMRAASSAGR